MLTRLNFYFPQSVCVFLSACSVLVGGAGSRWGAACVIIARLQRQHSKSVRLSLCSPPVLPVRVDAINAFCFYLHFAQRPNFFGNGVVLYIILHSTL